MKKKIAVLTILTAILSVVLTVAVSAVLYHRVYQESVVSSLSQELEMLSHSYDEGNDITSFPYGGRLTLIDLDGTVLFDSQAKTKEMENHGGRKEIVEAFEKGRGSDERKSGTLSVKQIYSAMKLSDGKVIRLSRDASTLYAFYSMVSGPLVPLLVILFILIIFVSSKASEKIVEPINALNLEKPEENDTYSEISPLLLKISRQQKEMKQELEDKERTRKEFGFITSSLSEGLVVLNREGKILSANRSASELLKSSLVLGESFLSSLTSSDGRNVVVAALSGSDGEALMKVGSRKIGINAYHSDKGGAVVLFRDVTERVEREEMRKEFTANVSHELKTPITTIMGFSELLSSASLPEDKVRDFASEINKEALRLRDIVGDIISLSYLDEGRVGEKESVDLRDFVEEEKGKLSHKAESAEVSVHNDVPQGIRVEVYGKTLSEVVANLLDNAIRYNRKGGEVRIGAEQKDNVVEVTVRDNGIGIDGDSIERIFERFYRVDKSRSRESGGTGLGLSIVKNGVEKMGGEVKVESTPGKGSVFSFTILS